MIVIPWGASKRNEMAEETKSLYFAYGSNMDEEQMLWRCPGAVMQGVAKLRGHRFLIKSSVFATVVPASDREVYGVLWRVIPGDESVLDEYEGVSWGEYGKEFLPVESAGGETLRALIYVAEDRKPGSARHPYMERVVRAAEQKGFPARYVAELKSWLRKPIPRSHSGSS